MTLVYRGVHGKFNECKVSRSCECKKPRSPPCFTVGLRCFLHFGVVPFIFWFVQMQLWKPKHLQRDEIFSGELFKYKPQLFCLFLNVLSWILTFNILTEACRSWDVTLGFTPVSIIQSDFKLNFSFLGSLWHWANTNLNAPDQQIMIQQFAIWSVQHYLEKGSNCISLFCLYLLKTFFAKVLMFSTLVLLNVKHVHHKILYGNMGKKWLWAHSKNNLYFFYYLSFVC